MTRMRLVVAGAAGRMGRMLVRAIAESAVAESADAESANAESAGAELVGALERPGSEAIGRDAGELAGVGPLGVAITDDPLALLVGADGLIDFTSPATTTALSALAAQARIVHVVGTTGLGPRDIADIEAASHHCVVVRSGNMSVGVNLLAGLVAEAARKLGDDWDVEIVEMHHRLKVDAPSGTALMLGEAAARGRNVRLADKSVRGRDGHTGARRFGDIGFASLRGGGVVGDHTVVLAGPSERIELTHRAEDRAIFAHGALRAALWGRGRAPGHYSMADVLGVEDV